MFKFSSFFFQISSVFFLVKEIMESSEIFYLSKWKIEKLIHYLIDMCWSWQGTTVLYLDVECIKSFLSSIQMLVVGLFPTTQREEFQQVVLVSKIWSFCTAILAKKWQILGLTNFWEEELERGKDPPHPKRESGQKFPTFTYWTWYQILLYFIGVK